MALCGMVAMEGLFGKLVLLGIDALFSIVVSFGMIWLVCRMCSLVWLVCYSMVVMYGCVVLHG